SLKLPESEYFPEAQHKTGIALHHTVCDSARTTLSLWERDRTPQGGTSHVATAYVIDKNGTIYEAFSPEYWAWQFGLSWPEARRTAFEKRFIGIEITSEGGLLQRSGRLYAYDRVTSVCLKSPDESFDAGADYRGYRWFDRYETVQLTSLARLVDQL